MVDFVDRNSDDKRGRCTLLSWWADFVGAADKIRNLDEADRRKQADEEKILAIGKSEAAVQHCARALAE